MDPHPHPASAFFAHFPRGKSLLRSDFGLVPILLPYGLANRLIDPGEGVGEVAGEIVCDERLGGILRYYHRKAA